MVCEELSLKVIQGNEFESIVSQWFRLAQGCASHYLHFPQWYQYKLYHFEEAPRDVHFFCYYRGAELVAVFPLQRVKESASQWGVRFAVSTWSIYVPDEMGVCDATILSSYRTPALVRRLVGDLRKQTRRWSVLCLKHLCESSHLYQALNDTVSSRAAVKSSHLSKYLSCARDHEVALAGYSKKFLRNLRRKRNKLESAGVVTYRLVEDPRHMADALAHFMSVEASGWKGKQGSAIVHQPQKKAFYQSLALDLSSCDHCFIHLLELDGRAIAGQLAVRAGATVYLLKIGYDEAYADVSPGFLLLDELWRRCCESTEIKRLSFVTGVGWMDVWRPKSEQVYNAYYMRWSWLQPLLRWQMDSRLRGNDDCFAVPSRSG